MNAASPSPELSERPAPAEPVLPERWPDGAEAAPAVAKPIAWWSLPWMVPLSILRPAYVGARVARTSASVVALVHILSLATAVCAVVVLLALSRKHVVSDVVMDRLPLGEQVRAALVLALEDSIRVGNVLGLLGPILAAPLLLHVAGWLLAWLLTPILGTGSTAGAKIGSAIRRFFWSTHLFACLSTAWLVGALYSDVTLRELLQPSSPVGQGAVVALAATAWWLWLLRLGAREVADTNGPAPESRPLCEHCGYGITGLPESGRCPECATPVAASLPHHRDLPSPPPARVRGVAFVALLRAALYQPRTFFRRLRVHHQQRRAIRFSLLLAVVAAGLLTLSRVALMANAGELFGRDWVPGRELVLWAAGTFLSVQGLFVALAWLGSQLGWRDTHRAVTVAAYACVWALPAVVIVATRPWLLDVAGTAVGLDEGTRWLVGQMMLIVAGASALIVVWQFRRGLKLTRFANA